MRRIRFGVVAVVALTLAAGCRESSSTPAPTAAPVAVATPDAAAAQPAGDRLPEDPAAGQRSTQQWREHMAEEEHERQAGYDRRHMKEHRALVKQLVDARKRVDRVRKMADLRRIRAAIPTQAAALRRQVTQIDHWGTNSRLLADYEALIVALETSYPDAREAALIGDTSPLEPERAEFDRHLKIITDWLKEAADHEDE